MRKLIFPFQARLVSGPGNEYAADNMRVGKVYTVYCWAGSCFEVSTDKPGDRTMIHHSRLQDVTQEVSV